MLNLLTTKPDRTSLCFLATWLAPSSSQSSLSANVPPQCAPRRGTLLRRSSLNTGFLSHLHLCPTSISSDGLHFVKGEQKLPLRMQFQPSLNYKWLVGSWRKLSPSCGASVHRALRHSLSQALTPTASSQKMENKFLSVSIFISHLSEIPVIHSVKKQD